MRLRFALLVAAVALAVCMSAQTDAYLDFLYRYMSLPDSTDYSRDFYEQNVALSLQARRATPWGARVPEREFRHFVLPVRVNNEHLDTCRKVFYADIMPRLRGMSMGEAVLEVNHWCHEHVAYRPTDGRTSSPLATVATAYGRCGEESTLLVSALRAVGIPARQVYTPRWAHTDDNHAWVEAWVDGQWHFLGACEPEPVLDLAWFNESASRAMLMHTKVFGRYDGPEEVVSRTDCYTEINVTANYAPTASIEVAVLDEWGQPAEGALVEFKLYNYAEFYTVASQNADRNGRAALTAGLGDLLVWASRDGQSALAPVSVGRDRLVTLRLSCCGIPDTLCLDIVPPPSGATLPTVTEAQRGLNDRRLAREDSIRQAYEATMPVEAWCGNHATIRRFLNEAPNQLMANRLLDVVSQKDLRDIELAVLRDNQATQTDTSEVYLRYVLNPRVELEWLTPYKTPLRRLMAHVGTPERLAQWCRDSISVEREWHDADGHLHGSNPQRLRMSPLSVWRHRKADRLSRDIFYVSAARSLGWPARVNAVDGRVQRYADGQWMDVDLDGTVAGDKTAASTTVALAYAPAAHVDDPKYYIHFTLSRIVDGRAQLLTFAEDATWQSDFSQGVDLEPGEYLLTTGVRLATGKVLAKLRRFVVGDTPLRLPLELRHSDQEVSVIGSLNAENIYHDLADGTDRSLLATAGRGFYVLAIVAPGHEPTNHALRDIAAYRDAFEGWGRKMIVLLGSDDEVRRFNFAEFSQLPSTVTWGVDTGGKIRREICEGMKLPTESLPLFLVCDSFNRVVFARQGYTINLGEQLLKVIKSFDGD